MAIEKKRKDFFDTPRSPGGTPEQRQKDFERRKQERYDRAMANRNEQSVRKR